MENRRHSGSPTQLSAWTSTRRALLRVTRALPRWAWVTGAALGVATIVVASYFAVEASRAKAALDSAASRIEVLQDQLSAGRTAEARSTVRAAQNDLQVARSHTDGVAWATATYTPVIGDDIDAVRTVADSLERIADGALPSLVTASTTLDGNDLTPRNGRVDLAALAELGPSVSRASRVLDSEAPRISNIRTDKLISRLAEPVGELQREVGSAQRTARAAAAATRIAPTLLGAERPRTYLLVFQNNAEIRPTGGLIGAYVILRAEGGALSIGEPGSGADLNARPIEPVAVVTDDERSLFPSSLATDIRSTNFTPDFPRAAALARAIVQHQLGAKLDGVLSLDPVALGYLLRGTGPVTLADGKVLTSKNAVRVLLNDVYRTIPDRDLQDLYFAAAAKRIFDRMTAGSDNSREVLRALAHGVRERRVMFWSADPDEQAEIAGTALANELPRASALPEIGLYLADASEAKMQYYLDYDTELESIKCSPSGVQTFVATTTMTSRAPANLPVAVTGSKMVHGNQRLIVRFYAPVGGAVTYVAVDGHQESTYKLEHHGRPVSYAIVDVAPGQTVTIKATLVSGRKQRGDARFLTTPGLRPIDNGRPIASACG